MLENIRFFKGEKARKEGMIVAERKGSHLICKDDVKHEHSVNKYTRMFYSKRICRIKFPSEATFSCLNATKKPIK